MADLSQYKLTITTDANVTLGTVTAANVKFDEVTISKTQDYYHGGNGLSADQLISNYLVVNSDANVGGTFNFGNGSILINSVSGSITCGNIVLPENGLISAEDNTSLRLRGSGSTYGNVSMEFVNDIEGPVPYNSKVVVDAAGARISTSGDLFQWIFKSYGNLTLPYNGNIEFTNGTIKTDAGGLTARAFNGNFTITVDEALTPTDPYVAWTFKNDGNLSFPDNTVQVTAYRNKPLNNLNLDGGGASTVFEVDMTFIDGGGSYVRGILLQDTYDGSDNASTNPTIDKILDGGNA